jgi:peroxiredoxin
VKNKGLISVFLVVFISMTIISCGQAGQTSNPNSNDSANKPFGEESTAKLEVGSIAPNFGLQDLNGKLVVLSSFRGKKVIVNMWDLQCHGCAEEIRFIEDYSKRLTDPGIVFLTINVYQTADIISLYLQGNKFNFPVLVDPDKVMPKSYVDTGTPTTFFIDKDGIIQKIKDGMFESTKEIIDLANSY